MESGETTEQALDLHRALRGLRRGWRTVLAFLLTGVGVGVLLASLRSPEFVARSGVLLPPSTLDAQGNPLRKVSTEVFIARSAEVLDTAGRALSPAMDVAALRRRVSVRAVNSDVLEVKAHAGSAQLAARMADAVAGAYVGYSNSGTADVADASVRVLRQQAGALNQQIQTLNDSITQDVTTLAKLDPRSADAVRLAALIDTRRTAQVDAARQLATLNTRVADAQLNAELIHRGLRVLEPATVPSATTVRRLLVLGGIGAGAGLVVGALVVLIRERGDRRLRRRDEISAAAQAPVLASVPAAPRKSVADFRSLLEEWDPSAHDSLAMRRVLRSLEISGDEPFVELLITVFAKDAAGQALAVELAAFAATTGIPTYLAANRHPGLGKLRAACHDGRSRGSQPRENLWVDGPSEDRTSKAGRGRRSRAGWGSDVTQAAIRLAIVLVATNPGTEPPVIADLGRRRVPLLAVSSGFATADELAAAALPWLDAGNSLRGVLVANPDPEDQSSGWSVPPIPPAPPARSAPLELPPGPVARTGRGSADEDGRSQAPSSNDVVATETQGPSPDPMTGGQR